MRVIARMKQDSKRARPCSGLRGVLAKVFMNVWIDGDMWIMTLDTYLSPCYDVFIPRKGRASRPFPFLF